MDAQLVQRGDGGLRVLLDRVGHRDEARRRGRRWRPAWRSCPRSRARPAARPGRRARCRPRSAAAGCRPARSLAVDLALDAARGDRLELRRPSGTSSPRSRAPVTMAWPSGCSEPASTEAAARSTSLSSNPRRRWTSVSAGLPRVIVPVLSSTTTLMSFSVWIASPERISTPRSAPSPEPTMIAVGVARPSAQGQAMTSTATADRIRPSAAKARGSPRAGRSRPRRGSAAALAEEQPHDEAARLIRITAGTNRRSPGRRTPGSAPSSPAPPRPGG
jgi:hypothetical protein